MTFRNSFSVNHANRLWSIVVSCLVSFLVYPVVMILGIAGQAQSNRMSGISAVEAGKNLHRLVNGVIGVRQMAFLAAIGLAVILAIDGFRYLYDRRMLDFYESQPMRRGVRFRRIYIEGFLIWFIPYLVNTALAILIAAVSGVMTGGMFSEALLAICNVTCLFLSIYSFAALAAVLSGRLVIGVLFAGFLLLVEPVCRLIFSEYRSVFYETMVDAGRVHVHLTPFYAYFGALREVNLLRDGAGFSKTAGIFLPADAKMVLIAAVALVLARLVFSRRKNEDAGKPLIYGWAQTAVKMICAIIAGLIAGLFAYYIFEGDGSSPAVTASCIFLMVLVTMLTSMLIQAIFARDIRQMTHHLWQAILPTALVLALFSWYHYDLGGYDHYIPKENEIESYAIYSPTYGLGEEYYGLGSALFGSGVTKSRGANQVSAMNLTNTEDLIRVVKASHEFMDENDSLGYQSDDCWRVIVEYHLTGGRTVCRYVDIPYDIDEKPMNAILSQKAYKEAVYPLPDADRVSGGKPILYEDSGSETQLEVSYRDFRSAYAADLANYDFTLASSEPVVGKVTIFFSAGSGLTETDYEVYSSYVNTIALLHSAGVGLIGDQDASGIEKIRVEHTTIQENDSAVTQDAEYTDPAQIQEILSALRPDVVSRQWSKNDAIDYDWHITIVPSDPEADPKEAYFTSDEIPKFVMDDLGE